MLLPDEPNIREVILFPLNQQGVDLMMSAADEIPLERLKELHQRLDLQPRVRVSQVANRGNRPRLQCRSADAGASRPSPRLLSQGRACL